MSVKLPVLDCSFVISLVDPVGGVVLTRIG